MSCFDVVTISLCRNQQTASWDPMASMTRTSITTASITINIKTLDSSDFKVNVAQDSSIPDLKSKIAGRTGFENHRQRLIFQGRVLRNDKNVQPSSPTFGNNHTYALQPDIPSLCRLSFIPRNALIWLLDVKLRDRRWPYRSFGGSTSRHTEHYSVSCFAATTTGGDGGTTTQEERNYHGCKDYRCAYTCVV